MSQEMYVSPPVSFEPAGLTVVGQPALAHFDGGLYCVFRDDQDRLWACFHDGTGWGAAFAVTTDAGGGPSQLTTSKTPSLLAAGGRLWLAFLAGQTPTQTFTVTSRAAGAGPPTAWLEPVEAVPDLGRELTSPPVLAWLETSLAIEVSINA